MEASSDESWATELSLLCLPTDLLLTILHQPELDARDLCRLEQTCTCIAGLIDDDVWRAQFLCHRRCNALSAPENWKQEYARRDQWSRGWRKLANTDRSASPSTDDENTSQTRLSGHTQKLRRFAMKMMGTC